MSNVRPDQNKPNAFPYLNFEFLIENYVKQWVDDNENVPIEKIILYRYSSALAKIMGSKVPTKYCVVFYIANEILPEDNHETLAADHINKLESGKSSIYDLLEYYHTIHNQDSYPDLMDASFTDVYISKPDNNFKNEWMFLTGRMAEGNSGIMRQKPCWVLYDKALSSVVSLSTEKQPEPENTEITPPRVNFFHKKCSNIWHIGYAGEKVEIQHYDGFSYAAEILRQKPGESVSCIALAQMTSSKGRENVASEDKAMDEGLYFDHEAQSINTPKARTEYKNRYYQLRDRLAEIENFQEHERLPDANLEKAEIEEEMNKIEIALKEKTFAEPNAKKAQSNIRQRLDDAYTAIKKAGMNKLADYLKEKIKGDGALGLHYIGTLTWEIVIE